MFIDSAPPLGARTSRLLPVGLVIALHLALVYGLASGLVQRAVQPKPVTPQWVLVEEPPPVEPPRPLVSEAAPPLAPRLAALPVPPIEVVEPSASPMPTHAAADSASTREAELPARSQVQEPSSAAAGPATPVRGEPVSAGLLCPVRPQPVLPATQVEGVARVMALGTVRGGRVVAVELQVLQALSERRAQRAVLGSIEQALRQGYQCSSDGVFSQEFVFRLE